MSIIKEWAFLLAAPGRGDNLTYSKAKRDYNVQYIKANIKRIPLDVQKDHYERIKTAADAAGESVNGYIKRAIDERMERDTKGADNAD